MHKKKNWNKLGTGTNRTWAQSYMHTEIY